MHGGGKVFIQESSGREPGTGRIAGQQSMQRLGQAAFDALISQVLLAPRGDFRHFPQPVSSQVPERKLRVIRTPGWTKVPEQPGQRVLDFAEWHEAVLPARRPPHCPQQQQRLVRRTLVPALPDIEFGELFVKCLQRHSANTLAPNYDIFCLLPEVSNKTASASWTSTRR